MRLCALFYHRHCSYWSLARGEFCSFTVLQRCIRRLSVENTLHNDNSCFWSLLESWILARWLCARLCVSTTQNLVQSRIVYVRLDEVPPNPNLPQVVDIETNLPISGAAIDDVQLCNMFGFSSHDHVKWGRTGANGCLLIVCANTSFLHPTHVRVSAKGYQPTECRCNQGRQWWCTTNVTVKLRKAIGNTSWYEWINEWMNEWIKKKARCFCLVRQRGRRDRGCRAVTNRLLKG